MEKKGWNFWRYSAEQYYTTYAYVFVDFGFSFARLLQIRRNDFVFLGLLSRHVYVTPPLDIKPLLDDDMYFLPFSGDLGFGAIRRYKTFMRHFLFSPWCLAPGRGGRVPLGVWILATKFRGGWERKNKQTNKRRTTEIMMDTSRTRDLPNQSVQIEKSNDRRRGNTEKAFIKLHLGMLRNNSR